MGTESKTTLSSTQCFGWIMLRQLLGHLNDHDQTCDKNNHDTFICTLLYE